MEVIREKATSLETRYWQSNKGKGCDEIQNTASRKEKAFKNKIEENLAELKTV